MTTLLDDLRGTVLLTLTKSTLVGLLALLVHALLSFSASTAAAIDGSLRESAGVDLYGIVDDLADPAAFEEYRRSPDGVRAVARFHDALAASDDVTVLSVFDNALPVQDFAGDERFAYGYGTDLSTQQPYEDVDLGATALAVSSVQLDRATFEFSDLVVEDGPGIDWDALSYEAKEVPVVLGADYRGVHDVGDTFVGALYSRPMTFRVVGFLPVSASIWYQGELDFSLSRHVVIPYPERVADFPDDEADFYGILAFAMINANVGVPVGTPEEDVLAALEEAARAADFPYWRLLGVPDYLTQFTLTRTLVTGNLVLLGSLVGILLLGGALLAVTTTRLALRRRRPLAAARWTTGVPLHEVTAGTTRCAILEHALAGTGVLVASVHLPYLDIRATGIVLAALVSVALVDAGAQRRRVRLSLLERTTSPS